MEEIRGSEPTKLAKGMEWDTFDCMSDEQMEELCEFLNIHYTEDFASNIKCFFDVENSRWQLNKPGFDRKRHLIVRNSKNRKILGCIAGHLFKVNVFDKEIDV